MHVHTYIRTYIRTYMHTYVHIYIHTYVHTYTHTYIYTYIHIDALLYGGSAQRAHEGGSCGLHALLLLAHAIPTHVCRATSAHEHNIA
jgi:hypothetical protein